MNEATLRKWHRRMGITLALFIFLQASSGLVMNVVPNQILAHDHEIPIVHDHEKHGRDLSWPNALKYIHHGGGTAGNIYRTLIGLGTAGMTLSGTAIFLMRNSRMKRPNIKEI